MATYILLTTEQADHVRGPSATVPSAALDPVERQDGTFILGIGVLADPAHEAHRVFLSPLPRVDIDPPANI